MSEQLKTQVLIVGAGPTGLMAANQLKRFGIDFIIIDKKSGPTIESRAILVTARSLEIYQQMGLSDEVVANGHIMTSFNLYRNGKKKGEIKLGELGKGLTEFGYLLAYEQSKNETILSRNLEDNGHVIHWNHEFLELLEHKDVIKAEVKNDSGEILIEAQYVIGCEGASSPIRHALDFSFKGGTYEQKFFVADVLMDWDNGYDKLIISPGSQNFCALMPLGEKRTYRLIGTLPRKYANAEDVTFQDIESVVKKTLNMSVKFEKVNWFSTYKIHHRAVDHFSEGRVFLAGDSAHIHSPAGGQGMNTGLQDAYNLCWKLAMVIKKEAPESLLKTYNEERLPFAKWLLKFTDRGFTLMSSTNWFVRFFRRFIALPIMAVLMKKDRFRPLAFRTVAQIAYSYKDESLAMDVSDVELKFSPGDRLPYFEEDNIYGQFLAPGFHWLHIGATYLSEHDRNEISAVFPSALTFVEDNAIEKWKRLGVTHELHILVRPDNYIAFITDELNTVQLNEYLKKVGLKV